MRPETAKALLVEVTDTLAPQDVLRTLAEIYKAHLEPHERRKYHKKALEDALRYHARQMENLEVEITKETVDFVNASPTDTFCHALCPLRECAYPEECSNALRCRQREKDVAKTKEGSSGGPTAHE